MRKPQLSWQQLRHNGLSSAGMIKTRLVMTFVLSLVILSVLADEAPSVTPLIQDNVDQALSVDGNSVSSVGLSTPSNDKVLSDLDLETLIRMGRARREWETQVQIEQRKIISRMVLLAVVAIVVAVIFIALHLYLRSKVPD